jgi:uncharacterized protein (DUF1015 family)
VSIVRPFAGLRPAPQFAAEVAAPPYDVLDSEEARALAAGKKWSFLHISKPEIDMAPGADPHCDEAYKVAAENMRGMLASGVVRKDSTKNYYVYRAKLDGHVQTGIAAAGSIEAYEKNIIRRHELTRPDKEDDRVRQILSVEAHTGPVFCFHQPDAALARIIKNATAGVPAYSVAGPGGSEHTLWVIDDPALCDEITAAFDRLGVIYIADGHHRSAAAARVRKQKTGADDFLVVSFPADEVKILDYNRVVRDLNGLTPEAFLAKLGETFTVTKSSTPAKPTERRTFGLYVAGAWYKLAFKQAPSASLSPVERLDVSLLTSAILSPILGVGDPRVDPRIDFVGGIRGMAALEARVKSGQWACAFALFPTGIDDLRAVADANQIMPPKSTWFEPKLADGMVSLPL